MKPEYVIIFLGIQDDVLMYKFFDETYMPVKEYYINIAISSLELPNPFIEMLQKDSGDSRLL